MTAGAITIQGNRLNLWVGGNLLDRGYDLSQDELDRCKDVTAVSNSIQI